MALVGAVFTRLVCTAKDSNGYVLHVDLAPVKDIVSLQRRCANNLNQIAVRENINGGVYPDEIKALQKDYADLWGPLSELLERLSEVVAL